MAPRAEFSASSVQTFDAVATWTLIVSAIGSLATVAGVIAAIIAGRAAFNLLRVESNRDARFEREQLSAQAVLVSCWYAYRERGASKGMFEPQEIHLNNASNQPIYDVRLAAFTRQLGDAGHSVEIAGTIVVPPGRTEVFSLGYGEVPQAVVKVPAVMFRDAGNHWWKRDHDGLIAQIPEPRSLSNSKVQVPQSQRTKPRGLTEI